MTVLDDHSRFNLALEACHRSAVNGQTVKERLGQGCTLRPNRILCDNGAPWGGAEAACPYTEFGIWLLRLGVELIHGRAYHPQTQGKEERFHRSMQAEVLNQTTAWRHLAHCQERFDEFRNCYNTERPHEALALRVPACCYQPSLRAMAPKLPEVQYLSQDLVRLVRTKGEVKFKGHLFYVGQAFGGQEVAFRPTDKDGCFDLFLAGRRLGILTCKRFQKTTKGTVFALPAGPRMPQSKEALFSKKNYGYLCRNYDTAQEPNGINGGPPERSERGGGGRLCRLGS